MPRRRLHLVEHDDRFIAEQVASGQVEKARENMQAAAGFYELDQGRRVIVNDDVQFAEFNAEAGAPGGKAV
jgi:hypothetical protein